METVVKEYLITEYHYADQNLDNQLKKLQKYPDILQEFADFIETNQFPDNIQSKGYTASKIKELAPFMKPLGIYNFLVDLRDRPDLCLEIIKNGFPRR